MYTQLRHHSMKAAMHAMHTKSLQSCPTLCNPMDCSLPASSVHGIFQARILERVAMPSSKGSYQPRMDPGSLNFPAFPGTFFTTSATWEAQNILTHINTPVLCVHTYAYMHTFIHRDIYAPLHTHTYSLTSTYTPPTYKSTQTPFTHTLLQITHTHTHTQSITLPCILVLRTHITTWCHHVHGSIT